MKRDSPTTTKLRWLCTSAISRFARIGQTEGARDGVEAEAGEGIGVGTIGTTMKIGRAGHLDKGTTETTGTIGTTGTEIERRSTSTSKRARNLTTKNSSRRE